MIEPDVTAVLGRRWLAFLIDSSLVAATGLGVAFQSSTAFTVVGRDNADKALVDPSDFEPMQELLDFEVLGQSDVFGVELVRAQEFGNSIRIFSQDSYTAGLLAAALAAIVIFGLVPVLLQRTIGMLPFGLGIKKTDGTKAGVGAHLVRTIVGFIDALPFVIPGALGFLAARGSSHRQRFGDRLAKTTVIDLKALAFSEEPSAPIDLGLKSPDGGTKQEPAAQEEQASPAATQRADDPAAPAANSISFSADGGPGPEIPPPAWSTPFDALDADPEPNLSPAQDPSAAPAEDAPNATTTNDPQPTAQPVASTPAPPTADSSKPPVAKPTMGDPLPPPPVHRKTPSEIPLGTPATRSTDEFAAETSDADDVSFISPGQVEAPTATASEHLGTAPDLGLDDGIEASAASQLETPDETWDPPREEAAPVWQPSPLETAPVEAPSPHDGRTLDSVDRIEPSIGALLASDLTDDDAQAANTTPAGAAGGSRGGKHSQSESSAKTPVWSDKWRAWMYWDAKKNCWLRHDADTNTWQPVG